MIKKSLNSFKELKRLFACAPMLVYYKPSRQIIFEWDASRFAIKAILSQLVGLTDQWHPMAFWSSKMALAERNYGVEELEMLAIIEACKHWRHYLESAIYSVRVVTDHLNLRKFLTTKILSRREARWWECLSGLDLAIKYYKKKHNPADGLFRRSDYIDKDNKPLHIVSYVTRLSTKRVSTQKVSKEDGQASNKLEVNIEPDTSESLLHPKVLHKLLIDNYHALPDSKSKLPASRFLELTKNAFRKYKQSCTKQNIALLRKSKKLQTNAKLLKIMSKPMWLYFLKDNNLESRVVCQDIKKISKQKSVFHALSFELRTVLKIMQKINPFAQEALCVRADKQS